MEIVNTLGRRKSAVARIYVSEGKGNITINKRELKDYFPSEILQYIHKYARICSNVLNYMHI